MGAVLLTMAMATRRMSVLTPWAATVLTIEIFALGALYASYSLKLSVENPMDWAVAMGVMAGAVAWGRWGRTSGR